MLPAAAVSSAAGDAAAVSREPDRGEIETALARHQGVIAKAARELGLTRQSLYRRMEKLGIAVGNAESP